MAKAAKKAAVKKAAPKKAAKKAARKKSAAKNELQENYGTIEGIDGAIPCAADESEG